MITVYTHSEEPDILESANDFEVKDRGVKIFNGEVAIAFYLFSDFSKLVVDDNE